MSEWKRDAAIRREQRQQPTPKEVCNGSKKKRKQRNFAVYRKRVDGKGFNKGRPRLSGYFENKEDASRYMEKLQRDFFSGRYSFYMVDLREGFDGF